MEKRIAVLGCGNIGMSVVEGIIKKGTIGTSSIYATKRSIDSSDVTSPGAIRLSTDNIMAVRESDIIVIAVKSYNFQGVLDEIKGQLDPARHIIVSVTTGITVAGIQSVIGSGVPVFRAMPNITASVSSSVTCICHNGAPSGAIDSVRWLFEMIGTTMLIDENLMESATILGSCGVAYVLRFIRAMIQGGIQIGFDAATASAIVNQTVRGAAELLIEGHQHPEREIDRVTTPKGCTIVGLNEMEHNGFSSSLIKGIVASFDKIERS